MGEAALLLAMLLAQPVASGLDDLDGNRVPDSWFVRSSTTRRFEVLANGAVRFNSSAGSAGQCLLSNGASSPPSWGSCAGGAGGYTGISDEGSGLTSRATLNFIGAGVTCVDNAGATRTDCTIPGGAGAAYATCQEEGTPLTQRATLNFIGAALTVADNAGSSRTDVTLSQSPASASVVGTGRTLTAGNGLTGGGDLSADRTLDVAVTAPITITGDSVALDQTAALGNVARTTVRRNTGSDVGSRRRLNFIEGSNITLTVTDDAPNEEVDVTIAAAGGGGAPGGSTTQLQYNNAGAFAGLAGATTDGTTLELENVAAPSAPASGVKLFATDLSHSIPSYRMPAFGPVYHLPPLASNWLVAGIIPGTGTAPVSVGIPSNTTGTASHPAIATTNTLTRQRRIQYASAATAGASAGTRSNLDMVWRGNAAGRGGFLFMAQFGASTAVAQQRQLVGVKDATAVTGNVNPSTLLDVFYFGYDSAQTTWRVCGNDNAGAATCVDCGANFPVNATAAYEGWLSADPNGSGIDYRLRRLDSAVADCSGTVSVSGDLPRNTVMLSTEAWINNGTTAAAAQLQLLQMWVAAPQEL